MMKINLLETKTEKRPMHTKNPEPLSEKPRGLRMKRFIRTAAIAGGVALSLLTPAKVHAQDGWANFRFGYSTNQSTTATLEGGTSITDKLKFYGFAELDGTKEKPLDLAQGAFLKLRVTQGIGNNFHVIVEDLLTNGDNRVRAGIAFTPMLGKGNYTLVSAMPLGVGGKKGPQLFLFMSQEISKRIQAQLLADYASKPNTVYLEPELNIAITKHLAVLLQGRYFGAPENIGKAGSWNAILGIKWSIK
ncbi:MAG: hypothetical protein WC488_01150 [Candidatus Micrarchaeia archaeon]